MTSELRVDNLKGSTTGGSINVLGEGTSATTNLQQGLAKAWVNFDQSGTIAISDSFNVSGISDVGSGLTDIGLSSAMSNTGFAVAITRQDVTVNNDSTGFDALTQKTVSNVRFVSIENAALTDTNNGHCIVHGDLA